MADRAGRASLVSVQEKKSDVAASMFGWLIAFTIRSGWPGDLGMFLIDRRGAARIPRGGGMHGKTTSRGTFYALGAL